MCIGIMLSEGAEKPVFMRICGVYRERGEHDIEAGFSRLYGRLSEGRTSAVQRLLIQIWTIFFENLQNEDIILECFVPYTI